MAIIEAAGLTKTYRVFQKKEGVLAALRGLYKREYREVRAVDRISFAIEPGEMVAFLGPNGAGKTTTLKMLAGLVYPTSGEARVLDFVPWQRADLFRRQFSLVMGQKNQLWWDLPAADSFQLHREIYSIPQADFEKTLGELTELLGVAKLTRQAVRELSLGERMKMELIAALLHGPRLLLLDEPTIGLDVVAQAAIQKCLRDYHSQRGVTMLLTSHYMRDVEALCDRVLVINRGGDGVRRAARRNHREVWRDEAGQASVRGSGARGPGPIRPGGAARGTVRGHQDRAVAGVGDSQRGPRPSCAGRRDRGRPSAGGDHRQGIRGGTARS